MRAYNGYGPLVQDGKVVVASRRMHYRKTPIIDLHLKGFSKALSNRDGGPRELSIIIEATKGGLVGDDLAFDFPSVKSDRLFLMAAALPRGLLF